MGFLGLDRGLREPRAPRGVRLELSVLKGPRDLAQIARDA